jgi:hypothetical protein
MMATCVTCKIIFHPNGPKQVKCNACRFPDTRERALQWRAIPGYEGRYEMSDIGTVLSLINGRRILRPTWMECGYEVCLSNAYGELRTWLLQRLLLATFRPTREFHRLIAIPQNGDKHDLRLVNWQWERPVGEHHARAKLTEEQVRAIKARMTSNPQLTYEALADEYGVTYGTIGKIMSGRTWKHVS